MKLLKNIKLSNYTTLKIGGIVKNFYIAENITDLKKILKTTNEPIKILGKGSNVLVNDTNPLNFCVIKLADDFEKISISSNKIKIGAAATLTKFIKKTIDSGLSGLEILAGIPGTIGGAIFGNAGSKYGEISNFIKNITCMDYNGNIKILTNNEINFEYRKSNIPKNLIIIAAGFDIKKFKKNDPNIIKNNYEKILNNKIKTQPYNKNSAGCIFKNPEQKSAGKLIDDLNLKNTKVGKVKVSDKHANFFITEDGAEYKDFITLINKLKDTVKQQKNIELEPEIQIWE